MCDKDFDVCESCVPDYKLSKNECNEFTFHFEKMIYVGTI